MSSTRELGLQFVKRKDNPLLIWLSASPGNAQVCLVFGINSRCRQASVAAQLPEEYPFHHFGEALGFGRALRGEAVRDGAVRLPVTWCRL